MLNLVLFVNTFYRKKMDSQNLVFEATYGFSKSRPAQARKMTRNLGTLPKLLNAPFGHFSQATLNTQARTLQDSSPQPRTGKAATLITEAPNLEHS